jgi:methanogenic corrinoid protein MtbC1
MEAQDRDAAIDAIISRINEANRDAALEILMSKAADLGFPAVARDYLDPAIDRIGRGWERGEGVTLAQSYVAAKVAEDFLNEVAQRSGEPAMPMGTAVIGNAEDDYHALGRRMLGVFLSAAGWRVVDLGNDVLARDFVDRALSEGASVIGVSAMMRSTALNIRRVRDEIDGRGAGLRLAVGGAVFNARPDMVAEVGGDGTSRNAIEAVELFSRLAVGRDAGARP